MKLALKYNKMNILEHSWKVVFFNIHECIKPKIIKSTWNKYTDQGYEKSKAQKAMVPKVISKDCWPHLYWYGLWAFVKVNKHLWSNSPICETLPSPVLLLVRHMLEWVLPFYIRSVTMSSWWSSFALAFWIFSFHPLLANWLQLWSEYDLESLDWIIVFLRKTDWIIVNKCKPYIFGW